MYSLKLLDTHTTPPVGRISFIGASSVKARDEDAVRWTIKLKQLIHIRMIIIQALKLTSQETSSSPYDDLHRWFDALVSFEQDFTM